MATATKVKKVVIDDRVAYSTQLVGDLRALSPVAWEKMRGHKKYEAFMKEYMIALCVIDFWAFLKYGIYTRQMKHFYEPLHGPLGVSGFLQDWRRPDGGAYSMKFLIMAREHVKTQTAIGFDCWNYVRDVNTCLLVRAFNDDKAKEIVGGVRELLDSPQFHRNFTWVRPKVKKNSNQPELWKNDTFMLARSDIGVRVPSAEACGMKADPTGGHFTLGHTDDFEIRQNANSESGLAELFSVFHNDANLFLAGAKRLFCGTPWSQKGLILSVKESKGVFSRHNFGMFVMPCTLKMDWSPIAGEEPILLGDRQTIRDTTKGFPTIEGNLTLCQARVRFFNPAVKDWVDEIREVEWNDSSHFRVNRPFPEMLGQPISYVIGTEKPSCPNRFTLDAIDLAPPPEKANEVLVRKSLPEKLIEQGSYVYSAQMMLDPSDPENQLLNPDRLQIIRVTEENWEKMLPEGVRHWYRASDYASDKKGTAYTAMTTAFWHEKGVFIMHIAHDRQMSDLDKILELLRGVKRVEGWKGHLITNFFEKAAIENTLDKFLSEAERDPFGWFSQRGEKYKRLAELYFSECGAIKVTRRYIGRPPGVSKNGRLCTQQPLWEAEQVHVVVGPGFVEPQQLEAIREEARYFRMECSDSFDILDTLNDIIAQGRRPVSVQEQQRQVGRFERENAKAQMRYRLAHIGQPVITTGWPPKGSN